jgi:hypothetical protein
VSELDRFVPEYQFHERHSIRVDAPADRVDDAIRRVPASEIFLFRALTWVRRCGRPGPEGILNAPADAPILDVATRTTFLTLADAPGREIVFGTVLIAPRGTERAVSTPEGFRAIRAPGFAVAAMNFSILEAGTGCELTTETRVFATDPVSRRRFARYWAVIRPGSGFLRRMWLRAIKKRAERGLP